ncbi:MAG: serine/threonine-protein kinase [Polyangiaceae bacterium]
MGTEDPYIGHRFADGAITLVTKIGEGGMGSVYLGNQQGGEPQVAVKILHTKHAMETDFVRRFKREVKILRSLRHPNTVRILGDGEMDDGTLYIVMEYLQGRGLDLALKQDGPWPLDRAIQMVLRVAYALEEAHRLGIVHRDLKPENIFLVQRPGGLELPKLLDFGLAKMNRAGESSGGGLSITAELTQEGDILGTPAFMSPEQSFGESLDGRADIYSLAVILYELLTGHLPFEESGATNQIARYLNDPIPIHQRVEGLTFPDELWPVLARALQKIPDDRFSTAIEFAEALEPLNTVQLSIAPPAVRTGGAPFRSPLDSLPLPPSRSPLPPPKTPVPPPKTPLPPRTPIPPATHTHGPVSRRGGRGPGSRGPSPITRRPSVPAPSRVPSLHDISVPAAPPSTRGNETVPRVRVDKRSGSGSKATAMLVIAIVVLAAIAAIVVLR